LNETEPRPQTIAPLWHTLLLLLFLLSPTHLWLAAVEAIGIDSHARLVRYGITFGIQSLLVLFVGVGLRVRNHNLTELIGRTWTKARYFREDVTTGLLFSICVLVLGVSLYILLGSPALERRPSTILPHTLSDLIAWVPLAISTAVVEELIFRGYFLQQANAYTRSVSSAICIQAVLFSLSHGYGQTFDGYTQKFILGLLFGFLTKYGQGILPATVSHAILDLTAGIVDFL
jgi:membrane protease YdiL (CAAX protease family)